jgi:hypothetical protein
MSYLDERRKHIEDGRPLPPKKKYTIPKKSDKRIQKEKEQGVQIIKAKPKGWFDVDKVDVKNDEFPKWETPNVGKDMDLFWKRAASVIAKKPFCWECNEPISKSDYRSATAHIFPKSIFESVADNEWNYLVLGARCGCHNKTHTMSTFAQMSIFPVAVQRYLKFGDLITENHKYLDLFLEYANQII